jgi:hypothetical protein
VTGTGQRPCGADDDNVTGTGQQPCGADDDDVIYIPDAELLTSNVT